MNYLFKSFIPTPPMLVNSTYWVISTPPPFIHPYRYIRGIIEVEILGRQQLQIILWNWGFYYYFYGIKYCNGELFWGYFIFGGNRALSLWQLWWDFKLLVSFVKYFYGFSILNRLLLSEFGALHSKPLKPPLHQLWKEGESFEQWMTSHVHQSSW